MSLLRRMKKDIKKHNKDALPAEMTCTLLGSFLLSLKIWGKMPLTDLELKKYYFKQKNKWLNKKVNEDTWMEDICKELEVEMPYGQIAFVVSKYNMLVAPIIPDKENEYFVLPLRQDGFKSITLETGKIYPISDTKEKEI